jgi:uncharacterized protein
MKRDCAVLVFAKAPQPGYAKTRLARAIGAPAAAALAARMLRETVAQAVAAEVGPVTLCCAPDASHPQFALARQRYGLGLSGQGEGDLGQRMWRALESALRAWPRVLLIGTDAPALDAARLRQAAELLRVQAAVFGPAHDGGYVLAGLARPLPSLFDGIAWSTPHVMAQTRARLGALGLACAELAPLFDVDEAADLVHVPGAWLAR